MGAAAQIANLLPGIVGALFLWHRITDRRSPESRVRKHGSVVIGWLVRSRALERNPSNVPMARILFSFGAVSEQTMTALVHRVGAWETTRPVDADEALLARFMRENPHDRSARVRLPQSMAAGPAIYCASVAIDKSLRSIRPDLPFVRCFASAEEGTVVVMGPYLEEDRRRPRRASERRSSGPFVAASPADGPYRSPASAIVDDTSEPPHFPVPRRAP